MENGGISQPWGVPSQPVMGLLRKATGRQRLFQWLKPKYMDSGFEETLFETLWPAFLTGGLARGNVLEELRHRTRAVLSHRTFNLFDLNLNGSPGKWKSAETKWFAVGYVA